MAEPTTRRRRRSTETPEQAVERSMAAGEEPILTKDADGREVAQRPINLAPEPKAEPATDPGRMVRVYHKRGTMTWLSNGDTLGHFEEKEIPERDASAPGLAPHIVRMSK